MQAQYLTNQLYDAQAWWIRDVILGKIKLSRKHAMLIDIGVWKSEGDTQKTNMAKINFQAQYLKDLWNGTNCPRFDIDAVVELFRDWELMRQSKITISRSKPVKSAINGTVGTISNVPWCDLTLKGD
jgi:trimethylamine monooxygenase